jgi:hypothetical protein
MDTGKAMKKDGVISLITQKFEVFFDIWFNGGRFISRTFPSHWPKSEVMESVFTAPVFLVEVWWWIAWIGAIPQRNYRADLEVMGRSPQPFQSHLSTAVKKVLADCAEVALLVLYFCGQNDWNSNQA